MARPKNNPEVVEEIEEVKEQPKGKKKVVYPLWDLWKIEATPLAKDRDGDAKQFKLLAVKKLRTGIKLEDSVAKSLNRQSHNSLKRYYKVDSVTNGDEETVTVD